MAGAEAAASDAPGIVFESYLKAGEIRLQTCVACGRQIFFPRTICPHCGDSRLEWRKISGEATVYSTTIVRQKPERGGDYNVAIVEFSEGARMLSRIEGVPPAGVKIGMPVQASIAGDDGAPYIVFTARGAV
ncbi:MAG: Zn-ribbon domain-containing OB-fold protein [Roseiarcus sp.]